MKTNSSEDNAHKQRRSNSVIPLLELLQTIQFNQTQRLQLREICSELLKSLANNQDRTTISEYIQQLASLINENFDHIEDNPNAASMVFNLLKLLCIDEATSQQIQSEFGALESLQAKDLRRLANLLNAKLNSPVEVAKINAAIHPILEQLAVMSDSNGAVKAIQKRFQQDDPEKWTELLTDLFKAIADSLRQLKQEKGEQKKFLVNVAQQLSEVSKFVVADQLDHQTDHSEANSLQAFVQEGMTMIRQSFGAASDLNQLKTDISANIEKINGGVDDFVGRVNQRHQVAEERNQQLNEKLSEMEHETQELREQLIESEHKLHFDPLTGVYNRQSYDEKIQHELNRFSNHKASFSYAITDIDHFKQVNDSYGHSAGDQALKVIAQKMKRLVDKSDYVFRLGGDEFALLLTNTPIEEATAVVESIRASIAACEFHFKGNRVTLTLSVGLTFSQPNDTEQSIYERADKFLYKAKNAGRNRQFTGA